MRFISSRPAAELNSSYKVSHGLQDFKEAARLAAEAKAKAAEADSELAKAKDLRKQASGLASKETAAAERLHSLEGRLTSAQSDHALTSWRQLKACSITNSSILTTES